MIVTATELADLQSEIVASMTTAVTHKRKTETLNSEGGAADSYATLFSTVCSIAPLGAAKGQQSQSTIASRSEYEVFEALGTDVQRTDKIVIGGDEFDVISVDKQTTDALCLRFIVVESK